MIKKKIYILVIGLILVVLVILGVSYALLKKNIVGDNGKIIYQVGDLEVKLDETGSKDIGITGAIPTEDSDGLKNEPYSFLLVNKAVTDLKYTIYLEDDTDAKNKCGSDCELIPYNFIRYNLSNDSNSLKTDNLSSSSTELYTGVIESKSTDKFNLRVWLSIDADNSAMGKYYFGKLKVVLSQADDYCIRNGFTKLSDCMLVMNSHESSVDIAKQNIVAKGTPDFSKTATTDEGLFMAEDDDGPSYYYRGAVKNNYVLFAGFMWRIIRQNGDGSVRMIYAGKKTSISKATDTIIKYSMYNTGFSDPTFVGYMYNDDFSLHESNPNIQFTWFTNTTKYNFSTAYSFDTVTKKFTLTGTIKQLTWKDNHDEIVNGNLFSCLNTDCSIIYEVLNYIDERTMLIKPISYSSDSYLSAIANKKNSTIKSVVDTWYSDNLKNYGEFLADATYCNDKDTVLGDGYSMQQTNYSPYERLCTMRNPSLKCPSVNSQFRINNSSAQLTYPIALITADEVAMAGGVIRDENNAYYLYNGTSFWTMTPAYFAYHSLSTYAYNFEANGSLSLWNGTTGQLGVRPVINLKSDVTILSGDGTSSAPYKITTN